jgi:hypothetical protein
MTPLRTVVSMTPYNDATSLSFLLHLGDVFKRFGNALVMLNDENRDRFVFTKEHIMWYRLIIVTILLGILSTVTPSYAASNNDDSDDDISPAAAKALASHDYEQVAMALFSAQTPADIAALTPEFEQLQTKKNLVTRTFNPQLTISDWIYASELAKKIANDQKLSNKMNMDNYLRLKKATCCYGVPAY